MEDKASNTISIIGIPKTATMEQVIIKQFSCIVYQNMVFLLLVVVIDGHGLTFNRLICLFSCSFADSWCLYSPRWCANAGDENQKCCAR